MPSSKKSVIITDLDNTLFDWVDIWYMGFSALLGALVRETGFDEDRLIPEIKAIHEVKRTSEYAFLIDELPSIRQRFTSDEEFHAVSLRIRQAFESGRSNAMRLYPGVGETLSFLKGRGCILVGFTESMGFYSNYRLRKLQLDDYLDFIYSPPDHDLPELNSVPVELYANHEQRLKRTKLRNIPLGEVKPNPKILLQIVADLGAEIECCIYVGDSLMKDVIMAQQCGIADVWARYGEAHKREEYELLRRVTHWTKEMVEKEKVISAADVKPSYTLDHAFSELRNMFDFVPFVCAGLRSTRPAAPSL
jgi:FMN phosphatase YigB (HAD superfamily)